MNEILANEVSLKQVFTTLAPWVYVLAIWEVIWKGFALWRAGRLNQSTWFIILLIFNTIGILPIIYLFLTQDQWVKFQKKS